MPKSKNQQGNQKKASDEGVGSVHPAGPAAGAQSSSAGIIQTTEAEGKKFANIFNGLYLKGGFVKGEIPQETDKSVKLQVIVEKFKISNVDSLRNWLGSNEDYELFQAEDKTFFIRPRTPLTKPDIKETVVHDGKKDASTRLGPAKHGKNKNKASKAKRESESIGEKITTTLVYLFGEEDGLKEKAIPQETNGTVKITEIIKVYPDHIEDDIRRVVTASKEFKLHRNEANESLISLVVKSTTAHSPDKDCSKSSAQEKKSSNETKRPVDTLEAAPATQSPPEISNNPTLNQLEKITNADVQSRQPLAMDLTDGVDIGEERIESMNFKSAEEDLGGGNQFKENVNDHERFVTALEKIGSDDEDWSSPSKHSKAKSGIAGTEVNQSKKNTSQLANGNQVDRVGKNSEKNPDADDTDGEGGDKSVGTDEKTKKSRNKKVDESTKILNTLRYLFGEKDGLKEKNIPVEEDGSVKISEIVKHYTDYSVEKVVSAVNSGGDVFKVHNIGKEFVISKVIKVVPATDANSAEKYDNRRPQAVRAYGSQRSYNNGPRESDDDIYLSRTMAFLLRHGAEKMHMPLHSDGYMFVEDVLKYKDLNYYSEQDVERIVKNNSKQRFQIVVDKATKKLKVRANQGHTLEVKDLELVAILDASQLKTDVVHGTNLHTLPLIRKTGLNCMGRNHIHFATGEPEIGGVKSGMRVESEVAIYIDVAAAIKDGFKFFRSSNDVILCPGDKDGNLPPKYISKIFQRHPRLQMS